MDKPTLKNKRAFTLIELLVVISIITLLMAVFGLSANKINKIARDLRQKAQLHSMEVGLSLFQKDFGDYPNSSFVNKGGKIVYGAQHLAEAMFGRDLRGVEAASKYHDTTDGTVSGTALTDYYDSRSNASKNRRKGPYMQFGGTGVRVVYMTYGDEPLYQPADLTPGNIYDETPPTDTTNFTDYKDMAPVVTDVYRQKKISFHDGTTDYVGTPVLYFKAKRGAKTFKPKNVPYTMATNFSEWTYDYRDNRGFYRLPHLRSPENPESTHRFNDTYTDPGSGLDGLHLFYNYITNTKVSSFEAPQNPETFILISAGADGIFGTKDDVTNFER